MILERFIQQATDNPAAICIVDDRRTLTYREAVIGSNMLAGHLEAFAPAADPAADKIGLLLPPSAAFNISFFGTRWLSRIAVPLNYLLRPPELAEILRDASLKYVLAVKPFRPLAEFLASPAGGSVQIAYVEDLPFGHLPAPRPLPPRSPNDVAVILYTSGTAGVPKGVMLTNRNLESDARNAVEHFRFDRKTGFVGVLPMFHALGLMGNGMVPMMLGCKVVYLARFSPAAVFAAVAKHQPEVLIAVPTMFAVLAAAQAAVPGSLASIRYAVSGGEPLPVPLIQAFKQKFNLDLLEGFGLTETSPILALNVPWDPKPGSAGRLIPEVQARIVADDGRDLAANQDGELWVQGPMVMKGYYKRPAETAEVLTADGWFKTGDIAHLDGAGYLFITGRKKDMIIMAGEKVFPREIEEVLKQHPAVLIAAVIGVKDESRGEAPVAFVQLKPNLPADRKPSANDLRVFVRQHMALYKTPREVYFLDDMPRAFTGKVLKRALKVPAA